MSRKNKFQKNIIRHFSKKKKIFLVSKVYSKYKHKKKDFSSADVQTGCRDVWSYIFKSIFGKISWTALRGFFGDFFLVPNFWLHTIINPIYFSCDKHFIDFKNWAPFFLFFISSFIPTKAKVRKQKQKTANTKQYKVN